MEAIDAINRKNGYGTIRQAIQGTDCRFDLKREYMSKQFTTNIHDILKVKLNERQNKPILKQNKPILKMSSINKKNKMNLNSATL